VNLSITEYATKFKELSRFCPYINMEDAMVSKCVKFESGLRPEIYQYICFHEIRDAVKAMVNHYKEVNDKKGSWFWKIVQQGQREEERCWWRL
jgi:hypothetical protein